SQLLGRGGTLCRIDHRETGQTSDLVRLTTHGDAFFHVGESNLTRHFGNDRVGVRIPGGHDLASLDIQTFAQVDHGAVWQLVLLTLATALVAHQHLAGAGYHDQVALDVLHGLHVVQLHAALG